MNDIDEHNIKSLLSDIVFEEREIEEHEIRIKEMKEEIEEILKRQEEDAVFFETDDGEVSFEKGEIFIFTN